MKSISIITPCFNEAGNVRELYEALYGHAIENILAFASGKPINVLNPEALSVRR